MQIVTYLAYGLHDPLNGYGILFLKVLIMEVVVVVVVCLLRPMEGMG